MAKTRNATQTQRTEWPEWVENAQQQLVEGAGEAITPYLGNSSPFVAPLTADHRAVSDGARGLAGFNQTVDFSPNAMGVFTANEGTNYAPGVGELLDMAKSGDMSDAARELMQHNSGKSLVDPILGMTGRAGAAIPVASKFATTSLNDIADVTNPLFNSMIDLQVDRIDDAHKKSATDIASRYAKGRAFGGSGEAIARSQLDRSRIDAVKDATIETADRAFSQGAGIAGSNTASENAAIGRTTGAIQTDANYDLGVLGQADNALGSYTNRVLSPMQAADGFGGNTFNRLLSGIQAQEGLQTGYTNRLLAPLTAANNMFGDYNSRNLAALGFQGSTADMLRAYEQQQGDKPYTQFSRFAGMIPGVQGTQVSTQPVNNSGWVGNALMAASLF